MAEIKKDIAWVKRVVQDIIAAIVPLAVVGLFIYGVVGLQWDSQQTIEGMMFTLAGLALGYLYGKRSENKEGK